MKKYYFTFGQTHTTAKGQPLKDYYVTVIASNYNEAREVFWNSFASIVLESADKWSFQYEQEQMKFEHFPKGQYAILLADSAWKLLCAVIDIVPGGYELTKMEVDIPGRKITNYCQDGTILGLQWTMH